MKKLIFLFPLFLFAFVDFSPCLKKYSFIKNYIPVTKNLSIVFDNKNCIKYDPFTKMCLIKSKNKKVVKFYENPKLAWWMASIKKNKIYVGNFAEDMNFLTPAKLSVKSLKNSVISDMFCRAYGIGRGEGFIKSEFVKHFINYGYWGDIGIDVDENMKIASFDPFYVKNLSIGEKIISINNKKATPENFSKYILLGKVGDIVKIKTDKHSYKIKIRKKIYKFTPLMHFGIYVDKNLIITRLPEKLKEKYYIKEGAKIIKVNNQKVSTLKELKKALSTYKNVTITLNFQGINLNIPLR
ncbi:conserved hypothetical protein [Lebetimonas natsushimae]|uniref:DUF7488 domain-containing protein n=1 Tax=Lebetimonas natsushimae TaxID=1936991 RepID=A0A292YBL6_9BACT|nr:hypothetical protein [Lebetimonas natsushimae]GAX86840.1 conserved hypothetical protein [Lebetimonas natsushimae]